MDETLITEIVNEITLHAATRRILYLASGGSSIAISVAVMKALAPEVRARLTFTLTDERYGPVGHTDSNWQQLKDSGLDLAQFAAIPVLPAGALEIEEVVEHFEQHLSEQFRSSPYVVALFGVGSDSHIAGILPQSLAVRELKQLVVGYDAGKFTRITITPPMFRMIDSAYVYARGEEKRGAIEGLAEDLPFDAYPNQLLKWCGHYFVSFNQ
jgi:6-phosphogluconolactonase/glucosamine-6-phosphate isomerase/deaminase